MDRRKAEASAVGPPGTSGPVWAAALVRFALDRPLSIFVAVGTLVLLGAISLSHLPVSLLPALERPRLEVAARAPGLARDDVIRRVAEPLERSLGSVPGVTSVRSTSGDGTVRVTLETEWQTDPDRLRIDVERRLADFTGAELAEVTVDVASGDPSPIVEVAVLGGRSGAERTAFAEQVLVPELARLAGAGTVETVGSTQLAVVVRPRRAALAARGLTAADLETRLQSVGVARQAGWARDGAVTRPLVVREDVSSLEQLRALHLGEAAHPSVVADVADCAIEERPGSGRFRLGDRDGVLVRVFRAPRANAVALAGAARARVAELARRLPPGLSLAVVSDRSREVIDALAELGKAAGLGLLLGIAGLRFALGRWRPALALAAVTPASIAIAFGSFFLFDVSLDLVGLAGLAIAAGMLVDNAIVVSEAIATARAVAPGGRAAAIQGTSQVATALVAGTFTMIVVFVPLIYLQGLARAFFGVQAFAIVSALLVSLFLSLTLTPVLGGIAEEATVDRAPGRDAYLRLLAACLRHRRRLLIAASAAAAVGTALLLTLPRELIPPGPVRSLVVGYRLPQQVSPARSEQLGADLAARLADAMAGSPPSLTTWTHWPQGSGPQASESDTEAGRLVLTFTDGTADARQRLRRAIAGLPELRATVEPAAGALVEAVARAGNRIELWADADTPEGASELADAVSQGLARQGWKVITAGHAAADTAWVLRWDEARLAALGLDSGDLDRRVSAGLGGMSVGRLDIPGVSRGLVIEAAPGDPLGTLPINASAAGEERRVVPLAALARLRQEGRAPVAEREDGRPTARVVLFARSADGGRALAEARQATGAGERIRLGGDARELIRSFAQLRLTLVLSLLLVLLTVVALYESLRVALVIMATVPLAVAGAAAALAAAAQTLNLMSFLGLILLVGLVVNNSIVLVHRSEQLRAAGTGAAEAVLAAARERYRPIVLTTLTTACGMLPLAVLGGEGIELRRPLAVAVLGGLATAWIASLLVVPALYAHFARRQQ